MKIVLSLAAAVAVPLLLANPAAAITAKQKMDTCKFGADDQKLTGAKRSAFLKNCMANRNDKRGPATTGSAGAVPPPTAIDKIRQGGKVCVMFAVPTTLPSASMASMVQV